MASRSASSSRERAISSSHRLSSTSALPVSTPPNAIVYGSGLLPIRRMILAGVVFDVVCFAAIWIVL